MLPEEVFASPSQKQCMCFGGFRQPYWCWNFLNGGIMKIERFNEAARWGWVLDGHLSEIANETWLLMMSHCYACLLYISCWGLWKAQACQHARVQKFYRWSALVAALAISFGQKPEAFHWLLKGTGITTIIENEHANVFVCSTSPHMRCHMHPRCSVVGAHYLLSSSSTNFMECIARVASTLKTVHSCWRFIDSSILGTPKYT